MLPLPAPCVNSDSLIGLTRVLPVASFSPHAARDAGATLGLGNLPPAVGLPQALVALELGQVFIVTLVARLVILWVRQSADESAPSAPRSNEEG